jgi:CheY-like chemotaxis protein
MPKVILLVEDDFFVRDVYKIAMEGKGYRVVTAENGEEARQVFDREQPDVVLLDIMLPGLNGIEVLKYIRQKVDKTGKVPVIMMTNLDTPESMDEAMNLGATEYWIKSIKDPNTVANEINHYVIE